MATGGMMVEDLATERRNGDSLFHYTNAAGLLGILRSWSLWATDLRFLNDAQEAIYALDIFKVALTAMENPALDPRHPLHDYATDFGSTFHRYRDLVVGEIGSPKFPVYVTCFCESGDLLSQWRGYGSDHGYALELRKEALEDSVRSIDGYPASRRLMAVRYGSEAAVDVVSEALDEVKGDLNLGHYGVHAHYMALGLTALMAAVKHPGFSEEREWRAIAAFEYENPKLVRFRSSPIAIVPYIEIPFPREAVVSVRVGPGRYVDTRQQGVERLLKSLDCNAEVHGSKVPLRT